MASSSNPSLVLHSPGKVNIENRPSPVLSDSRNVLVQIASTGICGSDLHYYKYGRIGRYVVESPMVLGHESAGVVVDVGSAVTKVQVGDRVALEPGAPCRNCDFCQHGRYNLCREMRFAATPPIDGTLCDTYQLPQELCYRLPEHVSLDEGAMAEPLSVAVHVVLRQAQIKLGDSVVIFGAGPIGLLCCAVARAFGAEKIVAVDINPARLQFAQKYAATDVIDVSLINASRTEESARILAQRASLKDGHADVVVDASGAESSIRLGIHLTRPGGTFVQAGMGRDDVNFPIAAMCEKELRVMGSFRYGPGDYDTAIRLMATQKVDVKTLITDIVPFERAEDAFIGMGEDRGIKTIIKGPSHSRELGSSVFK